MMMKFGDKLKSGTLSERDIDEMLKSRSEVSGLNGSNQGEDRRLSDTIRQR